MAKKAAPAWTCVVCAAPASILRADLARGRDVHLCYDHEDADLTAEHISG